uniref:Cap-specific mRNA (nucleoside-2'-O-)-methyltransferase n=1 Tax=Arcella intermedia TaxID=1963864 RepID=A0A6B2LBP5_9EUKA
MDEDVVVIYAGAAPGTHTNYLSEMFPRAFFYLVDPAEFHAKPTDRIEIVQDYFTDEMAEKLVKRFDNKVILFISDIRSMNREMNDQKKEGRVAIDMEWQMKWHEILKPKVSMLKFRLPYPPQKDKEKFIEKEKTNYLKGKLYFQIWCGRTSSETRLFVYGADQGIIEKQDYSHYDYENVMFHFQTVTRTSYFEHDIKGEGLDHCYDCSAEIFILSEYLKKKGYGDQLHVEVPKLSREISRKISSSRSLLLK